MPENKKEDGLQSALRKIQAAKEAGNKRLDLIGLGLTQVPDSVRQLTDLYHLDLRMNHIDDIPDFIGELSQLRYLNLGGNQIEVIPESITRLKLERLWLWQNQLRAIPDYIAQLSELRVLSLHHNQISDVSPSLLRLPKLTDLYLNDNQISTIPLTITQLTRLEVLDLSHNRLSNVPEQLAQLPRLKALFLHGNPGLDIPQEILGPARHATWVRRSKPKPAREILGYLAQAADSRPLNEAKLILVGQGAVGKTSLVKTLVTGKFNKREKNTEGIKISDWPCPLSRKDIVTVHVWDFGGQEMMHATHQFFLTQRSLYVLVLNRRQGGVDREADYWFRLIRAFGGKGAPVIVVLNKQKREPFEVNREGWLEKYKGNIRAFVATDCEVPKTITQLKREIVKELRAMESLKARFPRRWFAVKNALTQTAAEHISFDDYRRLCQENGESDPAGQTSLAGFLHDLGIALNYHQDPRLHFNYVLKPEWVTQGIYALLHTFVRTKGVFTHAEAESELAKLKYSREDTQFILGLMERFELSFSLGDRQSRVLIPELLDDQQSRDAAMFKPAECLNYGYKYPVLTEGLLPRFIARTHHLSRSETRWKTGVILEDRSTGCRALVRADSPEAEVRVHIDGPKEGRRELLGIIRYNFDVIHSNYEFQPEAQVYSPAAPQEALSVDKLKALAESKTTEVPIVLPDRKVIHQDIAALIEPLATPTPVKLFLSYSHLDESFLNELRKDLRVMERNGQILPWYDRALVAGAQWEPSILEQLNEADIVVSQISRNYLASDNCVTELKAAIKRSDVGEAVLVAYILTPCQWSELQGLPKVQVLPKDAKPLAEWSNSDAYWSTVADGIREAVKSLQVQQKSRLSAAQDRLGAGTP